MWVAQYGTYPLQKSILKGFETVLQNVAGESVPYCANRICYILVSLLSKRFVAFSIQRSILAGQGRQKVFCVRPSSILYDRVIRQARRHRSKAREFVCSIRQEEETTAEHSIACLCVRSPPPSVCRCGIKTQRLPISVSPTSPIPPSDDDSAGRDVREGSRSESVAAGHDAASDGNNSGGNDVFSPRRGQLIRTCVRFERTHLRCSPLARLLTRLDSKGGAQAGRGPRLAPARGREPSRRASAHRQ